MTIRLAPLLVSLAALSFVACGDPASTAPDAGDTKPDAADLTPDAGDETPDAGDSEQPDGGEDVEPGEEVDTRYFEEGDATRCIDPYGEQSPCDYIDVAFGLVQCGDAYRLWKRWEDPANPACRPAYTLPETRCDSGLAVTNAAGCSSRCVWRPGISVSFLNCDQRSGYIEYRSLTADGSEDSACPPVFEFAEGYFPTFEAWREAYPCPEEP